jgi:hypothetical protein
VPETLTKIRRFDLTDQGWTEIITPCACNYFYLYNQDGLAMVRCSDTANAESCQALNPGQGCGVTLPNHSLRRYEPGDVVTYLKAAQGTTSTAIVEFIP